MARDKNYKSANESKYLTLQASYNKEKTETTYMWKNLRNLNWVGGRGVRHDRRQQENWKTHSPRDLDPLHTLAPRPPDVCEKNVFRFIRSSASGKQHFFIKFEGIIWLPSFYCKFMW